MAGAGFILRFNIQDRFYNFFCVIIGGTIPWDADANEDGETELPNVI